MLRKGPNISGPLESSLCKATRVSMRYSGSTFGPAIQRIGRFWGTPNLDSRPSRDPPHNRGAPLNHDPAEPKVTPPRALPFEPIRANRWKQSTRWDTGNRRPTRRRPARARVLRRTDRGWRRRSSVSPARPRSHHSGCKQRGDGTSVAWSEILDKALDLKCTLADTRCLIPVDLGQVDRAVTEADSGYVLALSLLTHAVELPETRHLPDSRPSSERFDMRDLTKYAKGHAAIVANHSQGVNDRQDCATAARLVGLWRGFVLAESSLSVLLFPAACRLPVPLLRHPSRSPAMKSLRPVFLLFAALVLAACATTTIRSAWFDTSYTGGPLKRIVVVGVGGQVARPPRVRGHLCAAVARCRGGWRAGLHRHAGRGADGRCSVCRGGRALWRRRCADRPAAGCGHADPGVDRHDAGSDDGGARMGGSVRPGFRRRR